MADKEYIEREALMAEIHRIGGHNLCEWDTLGVKALAERQPTADVVEVRHGEWVQDVYDTMLDIYRCSCCETSWSVIDNDMERFNYCPNCGAKMDGKGDGE